MIPSLRQPAHSLFVSIACLYLFDHSGVTQYMSSLVHTIHNTLDYEKKPNNWRRSRLGLESHWVSIPLGFACWTLCSRRPAMMEAEVCLAFPDTSKLQRALRHHQPEMDSCSVLPQAPSPAIPNNYAVIWQCSNEIYGLIKCTLDKGSQV